MRHRTTYLIISILAITFVCSISIPVYYLRFNAGYNSAVQELQSPIFDNWIIIQGCNTNGHLNPSCGFGLNFSSNTWNKQINNTLIQTHSEIIYSINITASTGNLTEFTFLFFFNDASSFHYWKRFSYHYSEYINRTPYLGRTIFRNSTSTGIYISNHYINFRGFSVVNIIQLEIFISSINYE